MNTPTIPASTARSHRSTQAPAARLTPFAAALAAGLFVLPAASTFAATIEAQVNGCTLVDAIKAANADSVVGACPAGGGPDVITLPTNSSLTLTAADNDGSAIALGTRFLYQSRPPASGSFPAGATGLPPITSEITIEGNGSTIARVSADAFRIFAVGPEGDLTLKNTTVSGGRAVATFRFYGGTADEYYVNSYAGIGGGIFVANRDRNSGSTPRDVIGGRVTIRGCTISGNTAVNDGGNYGGKFRGGGGIGTGHAGSVTVIDSVISGNSAQRGGGIYMGGFENPVTIERSLVSDNTADRGGGMLSTLASINDSTISGNQAVDAGGVEIWFSGSIRNSTISDNSAMGTVSPSTGNLSGGFAGGIQTGFSLTISNSTISGNRTNRAAYSGIRVGNFNAFGVVAISGSTITQNTVVPGPSGGALPGGAGLGIGFNSEVSLASSIVSGNIGGSDIRTRPAPFLPGAIRQPVDGKVTSGGDNLVGTAEVTGASSLSAPGDQLGVTNPGLLALADNGGPTNTHALRNTSAARDAVTGACAPATDQRGKPRPQGPACDIGAFEAPPVPLADLSITIGDAPDPVVLGQDIVYTLTVTNTGPDDAPGVVLTNVLPAGVNLTAGAPVVVSVTGRPTATGSFTATADVSADIVNGEAMFIDPDLANNIDDETTTVLAVDTTPEAFAFDDVNGVALNTLQTSNDVTVSGINTLAPITVVGGLYSIGCTGMFTDAPSEIGNGQTVCVQHTSSGSVLTQVNTTLTVGDIEDTFTSTTQDVASLTLTPATAARLTLTQHCVTATAQDSSNAVVGGVPVSFAVTGVNPASGSASTNASGNAQFCFAGINAGTDTVNASFMARTATANVTWNKRDTGLKAQPVPLLVVTQGLQIRLKFSPTATLKDASGNTPIAGRSVSFKAGSTSLCTAVTNASGVAKCQANVPNTLGTVLSLGYTATYSGDGTYKPSTAMGDILGAKLF